MMVPQHKAPAPSGNIYGGVPDVCPHGSSVDEKNDVDDIILDADISPPQTKRTRPISDEQDELSVLKSKYKELAAKSQNFRMTAAHWKERYNQTVQSQVPAMGATRDNVIDQLMNDVVRCEDIFISLNRKRFTSRNKFRRHLAESMWHDSREIFVSLREFFLENAISYIRKEVYQVLTCKRVTCNGHGRWAIIH